MAGTDEKGGLGPSPSNDPDRLAADIERTREELAETLDAIAEKVSPKRVAKRTTKRVATAVKDTAHDAATSVKDTAVSAKEKVTGGSAAQVEAPTVPTTSYAAPGAPYPVTPFTTYSSSGSVFKPQYVAAGVLAALLAWLLLRKRR